MDNLRLAIDYFKNCPPAALHVSRGSVARTSSGKLVDRTASEKEKLKADVSSPVSATGELNTTKEKSTPRAVLAFMATGMETYRNGCVMSVVSAPLGQQHEQQIGV
ncbi:hypothetical protein GQ600_16292 [Phytophthora cactorum]|nr:hypothetical protein GQ600_16292 [Phytophthora cactorum]